MGETENRPQLPTAAASSRFGSHIVKSTGRKDRHSKVSTAKGLRDRRVRLSAHTAIQFYDVQDRLGYDRPSKAVDWLIMHSKAAIEKLDKLPAWNPIPTTASNPTAVVQKEEEEAAQQQMNQNQNLHRRKLNEIASAMDGGGGRISEFQQQRQQQQQQLSEDNNKYNSGFSGSGFLPYDADIANTIKSFFPMEATTASFQSYPSPPDLLSRATSVTNNHHHQQDLRLSLQSFQDPILLHQHHHQHQNHHPQEQVLFAGNTDLGFDGGSSGWSEQQHNQQQQEEQEHGRLQRMVGWNNVDAGGGGFTFNAAEVPATATVYGHGQYLCSQRGPLQSSNTPSVRAWIDPSSTSTSMMVDNHQHYLSSAAVINQSSMGFATPSFGGFFSNFRVPARIQGEEEHDGVSDKLSSASSDSRH